MIKIDPTVCALGGVYYCLLSNMTWLYKCSQNNWSSWTNKLPTVGKSKDSSLLNTK
jgi:hypothetical protein